ncbi:hypothetical protein AYI69_g1348 [Smittium culicis]|uniref:Uncharacterized protein n=1 Tax=Smittium culicis TaxID=133412 RepID=A0A1R1YQJ2_9FUNG|nr:hypothetical protein AYI69_g1348 [Smittium culicis]
MKGLTSEEYFPKEISNGGAFSLVKFCEFVTNEDLESLSSILTPQLYNKYKQAIEKNRLENLKSSISIEKINSCNIKDIVYYTGQQESFDPTIPLKHRVDQYRISILGNFFLGFDSAQQESFASAKFMNIKDLGMQISVDISINCNFKHVLKYLGTEDIVFSNIGTRDVILTLSSPYYKNYDEFVDAFNQMSNYKYVYKSPLEDEVLPKKHVEPEFSWTISDLDYYFCNLENQNIYNYLRS